ncbi:MAG: hypothetical protein JSS82_17345 [Bacteroidetes bacterium]|nr:hypothetical protein [Bacteroidota bacterium]
MRRILSILLLFTIVNAACHKSRTVDCSSTCFDPDYGTEFHGYQYSEVDTIIFRKYKKDSSFTTLLSEAMYTVDTNAGKKTLTAAMLTTAYDYELILPGAGDTYRISRLNTDQRVEAHQCEEDHVRHFDCENYLRFSDLLVTRNGRAYTGYNFDAYYYFASNLVLTK